MNGYPKLFKPTLILTFSLLFITGLLLLPSFAQFKLEWDFDWLYESPFNLISQGGFRQISTFLHALSGWTMLGFLGAIWSIHMRNHWRKKENSMNGIWFVLSWAFLFISALGIYYLGDATLSHTSSIIHTLLGLVMPLLLIQHIVLGRRTVNKRSARSANET